jgi:SNF2-related domain/Helicase conserved C-terminal domain
VSRSAAVTSESASPEKPRDATAPGSVPDAAEARAVLLSMAERKTRAALAPVLVDHVLAATEGADWPVRRAAMEATLRRWAFAARDGLKVAGRPAGGKPFGRYGTRSDGARSRPYVTLLEGLDPLRGSCDCPDFVRNSLGVCKHLLVALDALAARPGRFRRAMSVAALGHTGPRLVWDPVRPLVGPGDWLDRVGIVGNGSGREPGLWRRAGTNGVRRLASCHPDDPEKRLRLVEMLLAAAAGRGGASAEPAVVALLGEERERLGLATAAPREAEVRAALRSLRRRLYPYQIEGIERALRAGRLLLADDMGLGKTAQAIAVCHVLRRTGRVDRGLVIAPASLKPQWLREWQLFTGEPVEVVEGRPDERRSFYRRGQTGFRITNYEQVLRDLEWIRAWSPGIVVLDEAQRIKNWATKTAGTVKQLRPPYRLILTGTPMENRLEELASLFDWIDDLALEPKWRLAPFHATPADGRREIVGARNLDTLRLRLGGRLLRRRRAEVLRQLPPRTDTVVPVELTDAQRAEHDALLLPIARLVSTARTRPLTQAEFLRLMSLLTTQRITANGIALLTFESVWEGLAAVARPDEALLRSLSTPKLLELREIVRQVAIGQGRKIVVFSQWVRMLRLAHWAVRDLLAESGRRAVFFTGAEGARRRTHNLVDFHDDALTSVLFASDAGGVGLNLQRAASCCVNLELPWNPAVLEQRVGRIFRLGQKHPIDVYNLITVASIEERIAGLVSEKRALFTGLFDGTSDEIRFERSGSFLSRLERIVEPAPGEAGAGETEEEDDELEAGGAGEVKEDELEARGATETGAAGFAATDAAGPVPPSAAAVRELFAGVAVRRRDDGGITIDARPESSQALLSLFEGMASLLRRAGD